MREVASVEGAIGTGSLAGLAANASGEILLYFSDHPLVWLSGSTTRTLRLEDEARIVGVGWNEDGGIEVVDAARRRVMRLVADTAAGDRSISGELPLEGAVRLAREWIVGGRASPAEYRLFALDGDAPVDLAAISIHAAADFHLPAPVLAPCGDAVLVTEVTAPFRVHRWSAAAGVRAFDIPPAPGESAARWISAPAVCVGDHVLQTLVDPGSDRRVFVVYEAEGRVARTTMTEVPMAVVAAVPGSTQIVAIRRIGEPEIVLYDWSWTRD